MLHSCMSAAVYVPVALMDIRKCPYAMMLACYKAGDGRFEIG